MCEADVRQGVAACPFLRRVAATQGESFAMRLAVNPFKPVVESGLSSPLFPEDAMSFESAYSMFHGAQGMLPLGAARESQCLVEEPHSVAQVDAVCAKPDAVCLPLAAMSFSNNFGKVREIGCFGGGGGGV